jgi:hypothetical protein
MNSENKEQQGLRNKIKISLDVCEKVLDDFSNLNFVEISLMTCEQGCYSKYFELFNESEKSQCNYKNLKNELYDCTARCDDLYRKVLDHQAKGAEISYVKIF